MRCAYILQETRRVVAIQYSQWGVVSGNDVNPYDQNGISSIASLSVWIDEDCMDGSVTLKDWMSKIDAFKTEQPLRRTGKIRNVFTSTAKEESVTGYITMHILTLKEDGENGVDSVIERAIQEGQMERLNGLLRLATFKLKEDGNFFIVSEYVNGQVATFAAGLFMDTLIKKMETFIAIPQIENILLRMGAVI